MDVEQRQYQAAVPGSDSRSTLQHMPVRVQRLVAELRALCVTRLEPALLDGLQTLDDALYQQAERSRGHLEQQRCFDSRAMVRCHRAAFVRLVSDHVTDSFTRLGDADGSSEAPAAAASLSLLDRNEHELNAALEQLTSRGEAHTGPVLAELSYRMAVLVGAPPLEGDALPASPPNLALAVRRAIPALDLPPEHQLMLVQVLERKLAAVLPALYEAANAQLLGSGILPHLRAFAGARPANAPPAPPSIKAPAPAAEPAPAATATSHEPIAVLETLRDLLARQRAGEARVATDSAASAAELEIALGALQKHLVQVTDRASRELRSAQRLREELLAHLNAGKPTGAARTGLSPEQDDTVELVARLFEQLGQQLHQGPGATALLGDLQVPILRMAMTDRSFFEQDEHPARHLLGTLAEASNEWGDGKDIDPDLATQLSRLVARAQREAPSAGLYTSLLADIRHHLAQLSRKAQVTERRQVEAMQGRERLHQARERATEVLAARFAEATPRGLLRALLDRAWSDVLALALLRHGEDSEAFAERLRITDQLLGRLPVEDPLRLRLAVEDHLQQIGMQAEEAEQVAHRLIGGEPAPARPAEPAADLPPVPAAGADMPALAAYAQAAEPPSATDLALRLKQRQRLGEQRGQEARPAAQAPEPPLGPQEARIHNRLRQLPFGSWFEFIDPQTGAIERRKLAWFSPLSGNSLFVNRRGQRMAELNLRELAAAIASGRVREQATQRDGLFDRAWRALAGSLQRPSARA
ncbi:DUF1631 family protein [Frateuria hangzhouensis]|uniref:DUF1631 family protein n=1 Tax=Frateuria hangzhouensis TaxID=2995589 RepID=UPI002260D4B3|nr:DUF1631 family protein [Frateuria sp. STR12]MCX7515102.1 DUF1631 family protein [Frateuria sp. STR12]